MDEPLTAPLVGDGRAEGSGLVAMREALISMLADQGIDGGTADAALQAVGGAASGEWTAADTTATRRMVPFQNLFWLRHLFDQAESGLNQALGVPEKR